MGATSVASSPIPPPEPLLVFDGSRPYAYANLSDVQDLLAGFVFSATSRPTATQAARQLYRCSDEIDSLLSRLDYAVPVPTGATQSMQVSRVWTAVGAAYRVSMAMPQGKESKHAEAYGREWKALLEGLEGGKRSLPDAPKIKKARSPAVAKGGGESTFTRENAQTLR